MLPDYDQRTKRLFGGGIATLISGLFVGLLAGAAWITGIVVASAVVTSGLIGAATWSAITSRARDARKLLLPSTVRLLADVPFDDAEIELVLATARENGSPVATARVLRSDDLTKRASREAGPYR
jgi:hypothetical protein